MTAEIAILNTSAVALAADSAASISYGQNLKVYNSADKLFQLDGRSPVGVMIYGTAQYMGVPWETVIKLYRRDRTESHDYLKNYAEEFIQFLKSNVLLSDEHIDLNFKLAIEDSAHQFAQIIRENSPQGSDHSAIDFSSEIKKIYDTITHPKRLDECDDAYEEYLHNHYIETFYKAIKEAFGDVDDDAKEKVVKTILGFALSTPMPEDDDLTGLVIAGFGEAELYPSSWKCFVRGILPKRVLQIGGVSESSIALNNTAIILPFAQQEMVDNFMTGVDPDLEHHFFSAVGTLLDEYVEHFTKKIAAIGEPSKTDEYEREARELAARTLKGLRTEMRKYSRNNHINPIIDAVAMLPKDELAFMAETLVALTSFKRRVSNQAQTVGGAVDVAIISKGDGFIWIKRKHYFDPALNVRYINRIKS